MTRLQPGDVILRVQNPLITVTAEDVEASEVTCETESPIGFAIARATGLHDIDLFPNGEVFISEAPPSLDFWLGYLDEEQDEWLNRYYGPERNEDPLQWFKRNPLPPFTLKLELIHQQL